MRIRTIKPEFWKSPKLAQLSWGGRLLFAGIICLSDDEGRFLASPRYIASELFPHDRSPLGPVTKSLPELSRLGLVVFYECSGIAYGFLPGFREHQRVEKPTPSKLPTPPNSPTPPRLLPDSSPTPPRLLPAGREGKGREGNSERKGREVGPPAIDSAEAFWLWLNDRKRAAGHTAEHPPRDLSGWWSGVMMELNGAAARAQLAAERFLGDPYWKAQGCPFAALRKQWPKYASEHYGQAPASGGAASAADTDWSNYKVGDIYRDLGIDPATRDEFGMPIEPEAKTK